MSEAHAGDEQLMLRYGEGDAAAFDELYARHRAPLWRYLARNLRDDHAVADVFQDIWGRVIVHRERYEPRAKFTTWLYRIAQHCCVDHWRRAGRRQLREIADDDGLLEALGDDDAPTPETLAASAQSAARLGEALAALPDAQRAAFLMYVEGGMSVEEIASATGVGTETAKSRLRYAAAKLKQVLGAAHAGEAL